MLNPVWELNTASPPLRCTHPLMVGVVGRSMVVRMSVESLSGADLGVSRSRYGWTGMWALVLTNGR